MSTPYGSEEGIDHWRWPELLAACEELLDAYAPQREQHAILSLHSSVRKAMQAIQKAKL